MNAARGFNIWMIVSGVILAVFGIICITQQGLTLGSFTLLAGAGFTVSGIFDIVAYISGRKTEGYSGWMLFEALVDLLVGLMLLLHPLAFAAVIPWVIAGFIVAAGLVIVISGFRSKSLGVSWMPLVFSGILTIIFGLAMFVWPGMLAVIIGIYAIVRGVALIVGGAALNRALRG